METTPADRSKRLHNFSLPYLKWGNQKFLRCVKLDDQDQPPQSSSIRIEFQSKPTNSNNNNNNNNKAEDNNINDHDDSQSERPWNLRTRRAACNAPLHNKERKVVVVESARRNERVNLVVVNGKRVKERLKFSVSLSKDEIQADFKEMLGIRPPRRPKKRPRIVQKQLDSIFPGLWLTEVTPDSYKVPDVAE